MENVSEQSSPIQLSPSNQSIPNNHSKSKRVLVIIIGVISIIFVMGVSGYLLEIRKEPSQTYEQNLVPSPTPTVPLPILEAQQVVTPINKIVLLKDGGLAIINPDGSGLTQVFTPNDSNHYASRPVWSPNGKKIAFTETNKSLAIKTNPKNNASEETGKGHSLMIVDLVTKETKLLMSEIGSAVYYSWSPDSNYIVYNADGSIKIVDIKTKIVKELANNAYLLPIGNLQGKVEYYIPSPVVWSPKNQIFYLQRVGQNTSQGEKRLTVIEQNGSQRILIPDKNIEFYGSFSVSQDGTKIVYSENKSGYSASVGIWIIDSDGLNNKPLTKEEDMQAASLNWSPDSKKLLATQGLGGIYLIDADSGSIEQLPILGVPGGWSPDSKKIVYTAQKPKVDKGEEIRIYDLSTKKDITIGDSFSSVWVTAWSPI